MANRTTRTPKKIDALCEAIAALCGNITGACKRVGVTRSRLYAWCAEDAALQARIDQAVSRGLDAAEDELLRRGTVGTLRPVFYLGKRCGYIREFDTTAAIFMLKGGRPDKYRERLGVDFNNASPEQIEKAILSMPDDKLRAILARLRGPDSSGTEPTRESASGNQQG